MKKILFTLFALNLVFAVNAQEVSNKKAPSIALKLSAFDFKTARLINANTLGSVLSDKSWEKFGNTTKSIGVQYFKGLSNHVDFMANVDFASLQYPFYVSSKLKAPTTKQFYAAVDASVNLKMLSDDYKVVPYITLGIGMGAYANTYYTAYAPAGFGLQIKAAHGSFINILSTYRAEMSSIAKTHFNHGISYSMPLKLKEKKPVVLPPPPPPADTDNDGVIDEKDKCPTVAGLAKYNGCPIPDTDKDGVNDEQDKCPTVAGLAKYNGCPIPDTDKDGVNDEQDKCPTVAGLTRYNGCPIPDSDNDGVNDEQDKCPNEAGIAANNGCPDIQPILTKASSDLKFQTGKSFLSKKQLAFLDEAVEALNKYPNVKVDVSGNTDNTGAEKLNKKLSANRASVVSKYLISKGIMADRLILTANADTKPVGDNKTKAGRGLNRRTDLTAVY